MKVKLFCFILPVILAIIVPSLRAEWYYAGGGGAADTYEAYDTFTGDNETVLSDHTSDSSHTWTLQGTSTLRIDTNRVYTPTSSAAGYYYSSVVPTDADYSVKATFYAATGVTPTLYGRCSTSATTAYGVRCSSDVWELYRFSSGVGTSLGTYSGDSPSTQRVVELSMVGTAIKVIIGGVERISVTDSNITDKGRPGVGAYYATNSTARWIDSWEFWD